MDQRRSENVGGSGDTSNMRSTYTAADVQEAFERGVLRGEEDANERNYCRRKYEALKATAEAQR